jgi:protein phosphatase
VRVEDGAVNDPGPIGSKPNARVVERSSESDPGLKRATNQDRVYGEAPLFVVADGMGGHAGGEVAAAIAVDTFRERASLCRQSEPSEALHTLVTDANARIWKRGQEQSELSGMGTTVTAALVHDDAVTLAHVGDSRAYRLRGGALEQLTEDHSYVAELVRLGALTPEEAERHPHRSRVSRALGIAEDVEPDITTHVAEDGDIYILCSDGLSKMISDDLLRETIVTEPRLEAATEKLIALANQRGGEDNITVCLFRLAVPDEARKQTTVIDQSVIARAATAERPAL